MAEVVTAASLGLPDPATATRAHVAAVIAALYDPSADPRVRKVVDAYIHDWQQTPAAWSCALELLGEDPSSSPAAEQRVYVGALTLHTKLRVSYGTLGAAELRGLMDTLQGHILRLSEAVARMGETGGSADSRNVCIRVLTRLCLALSCAHLLTPASASDVVHSFVSIFPPTSHMSALSFLSLLAMLPEETMSQRMCIPAQRRTEVCDGLAQVSAQVFGLLAQLLSAASRENNSVLVTRVFRCVAAWMRDVNVPAEVMISSRLLESTFAAVQSFSQLFEVCLDVVSTAVYRYRKGDAGTTAQALTPWLLSQVLLLEPLWDKYVSEDAEENLIPLARLFADAIGYNIASFLFVPSSDATINELKLRLIRLVLKGTLHTESEVSVSGLIFFRALGNKFVQLTAQDTKTAISGLLGPVLVEAAAALVQRLAFPSDFATWSEDDQYQFNNTYRYDVTDAIAACVEVAGVRPIVEVIANQLNTTLNAWISSGNLMVGWQRIEAILTAIRVLSFFIAENDETVMPFVLDLLPKLPALPELRSASYRLVDRFYRWICARPAAEIQRVFEFIVSSAFVPPADASGARALPAAPQYHAAKALFALTQHAPAALLRSVLELPGRIQFSFIQERNAERLVSMIVSEVAVLPQGQHGDILVKVVSPTLERLINLVQHRDAAVAAACADGSMLAAMVHDDGTVQQAEAAQLDLELGTLRTVVRAAVAANGRVEWRPDLFKPAVFAERLVNFQLCLLQEVLAVGRIDEGRFCIVHGLAHSRTTGPPVAGSEAQYAAARAAVQAAQNSIDLAVVQVLSHTWQVLDALIPAYRHSPAVHARIAQMLSNVLRHLPVEAARQLLPRSIAATLSLINASVTAEVLFLARAIVREFGSEEASRTQLWGMAVAVIEPVLGLLNRDFLGDDDLLSTADGLLDLTGQLSLHFPSEIIASGLLDRVVEVALMIINSTYHRDWSERAMTFLHGLLQAAVLVQGRQFGMDGTPAAVELESAVGFTPTARTARPGLTAPAGGVDAARQERAMLWRQYVNSFLERHGINLCKALLRALYNMWPPKAILDGNTRYCQLMMALQEVLPDGVMLRCAVETAMLPGMMRVPPSSTALEFFARAAFGVRFTSRNAFTNALEDLIELAAGREPVRKSSTPTVGPTSSSADLRITEPSGGVTASAPHTPLRQFGSYGFYTGAGSTLQVANGTTDIIAGRATDSDDDEYAS